MNCKCDKLDEYGYIDCPQHGKWYRPKAEEKIIKREKIGRYSGKSKSQNAWNDYQ